MIVPPDHLVSLEEWIAFPEDKDRCYELQEGVLIAGPRPGTAHQLAVLDVMRAAQLQLPREFDAVHQVEVITQADFPPSVRVPDFVIHLDAAVPYDAPRLTSDQVTVAVEITAPGTRDVDFVQKSVEYARAGIPHYWIIEIEPAAALTAYRLEGGIYEQGATAVGTFTTEEPFPLSLVLTDLIPHRRRKVST